MDQLHRQPPKAMVGARIPKAWVEKLKALSEATGRSQTDLIVEAISRFLDEEVDTMSDRLLSVEQEIHVLHQHLTKVPDSNDVAMLAFRVQKLEEAIATVPAALQTRSSGLSTLPTVSLSELSYEDIEDEPDEILYDFLEPEAHAQSTLSTLPQPSPEPVEQPPQPHPQVPAPSAPPIAFREGIAQKELCLRYEIDASQLSRATKRLGKTPQQYLEEVTGWTYQVSDGKKRGKWFPPLQT